MTEEEEMYRLMNEEDPFYMGPKSSEPKEKKDKKKPSERESNKSN